MIASEASKIFWQFQMQEWRFYVLESLLDLIQDNFLQIPDFFQTGTPIPDFFQTFQTFPDFCLIPDISGRRGNPAACTTVLQENRPRKPLSWIIN